MKIRNGFVSNSSSSSFVVMGSRISKEELEELGWYDDDCGPNENKLPQGICCYYNEDEYIVGIPLCESEDWGLSSREFSENELKDIMLKTAQKLNRPIKLMMGTRPT